MSEKIKHPSLPDSPEKQPSSNVEQRETAAGSPYGPVGGRGIVVAALNERQDQEAAKKQSIEPPRSDFEHPIEPSVDG